MVKRFEYSTCKSLEKEINKYCLNNNLSVQSIAVVGESKHFKTVMVAFKEGALPC